MPGVSLVSSGTESKKTRLILHMNPHVTPGRYRWLPVRAVIFGLAVSNFALVWTLDQRMGGIAALVYPWYHPWSYFNEPSRLLVAASLLTIGRAWGDLAAVSLSAYMVIRFIYLFAMWNDSWHWSFLSKYEPYFVGSYESQYLLALVILCAGVFYLMAEILRRNI
jgi:hypothetical protein